MGISEAIGIYTDGACSQNGTWKGGWGAVVVNEEKDTIINQYTGFEEATTNNIMEMRAFLKALEFILDNDVKNNYKIYSDSAYILNCFSQKWYINWQKNGWVNAKKEPVANKELWKEILTAYQTLVDERYDFTFVKVKGHADNKYNNIADKLAVEASK